LVKALVVQLRVITLPLWWVSKVVPQPKPEFLVTHILSSPKRVIAVCSPNNTPGQRLLIRFLVTDFVQIRSKEADCYETRDILANTALTNKSERYDEKSRFAFWLIDPSVVVRHG
jgi:hypothetical protein